MKDRYKNVLDKIDRYRENKSDTIFDDFYRSDLDIIEECVNFKSEHDKEE